MKHALTAFVSWLCLSVLVASPARAADKELNLFAWSEYVPQEVIDGFTKETGVKVNYETYASNEELLTKLQAGAVQYDLIQPSEYVIEQLIKQNKLAAIDHDKVPNLKNLAPEFQKLGHDPDQKFSVPYMAGTVGIVFNSEKVTDPIKGFKDVFQPKYKARIVVVNDAREIVTWAMNLHSIPINAVTRDNLKTVKPTLAQWLKLVRVFDSDSPKTALLNGDCDLGVVWSGEAALCWEKDKKFKYVLPAEGAHQFIDNLAIPADAPHKEHALAFINYILRPEVSKIISDKFPYTNPNAEARKLLSKDQLANPASYPETSKLDIFHAIDKQAAQDVDKLITQLKSE